jgi:hypothetical protein
MSNARMLSHDQRLDRYVASNAGRPLTGPQLKRLRQKGTRAAVYGDKASPTPHKLTAAELKAAVTLGRSG